MNRRGFIGAILGTAAATALPSEIWPFRKIFLPPAVKPEIWLPVDVTLPYLDLTGISYYAASLEQAYPGLLGLSRSVYPGRLEIKEIDRTLERLSRELDKSFYDQAHQMARRTVTHE